MRLCHVWAEFLHARVLSHEGLVGQGDMPQAKIRIWQVLEGGEDLN